MGNLLQIADTIHKDLIELTTRVYGRAYSLPKTGYCF